MTLPWGSLEAYMQLHPTLHLSLHEYSETRVEQAGLVTLDAKLDLKRSMDAAEFWFWIRLAWPGLGQ